MTNQLIHKCKSHNRKAQRAMVDELSSYLFVICRRYALSEEDARDLLQEALILIFNNINQFKGEEVGAFKAWCKRIAINNALEKKRKKGFRMEVVQELPESGSFSVPDVYAQLNVEDILSLLEKLPENQRIVFNLFVIDGIAHREIAKILQIKESSSRTFLTRARQELQLLIGQEWSSQKKSINN